MSEEYNFPNSHGSSNVVSTPASTTSNWFNTLMGGETMDNIGTVLNAFSQGIDLWNSYGGYKNAKEANKLNKQEIASNNAFSMANVRSQVDAKNGTRAFLGNNQQVDLNSLFTQQFKQGAGKSLFNPGEVNQGYQMGLPQGQPMNQPNNASMFANQPAPYVPPQQGGFS